MELTQASNQWASRPPDQRFESLSALRASVANRCERSRAIVCDAGKIRASEQDGTIVIDAGEGAVEPTHWSFGQLAGWLGAPPSYLRKLSKPLAVDCLNYGIKRYAPESGDRSLKFLTVTEDEQPHNTLQAVTSPTYGRIWDADVVESVQRVVERSGGRFHNPKAYGVGGVARPSGLYASDQDVFCFLIDGGSRLDVGPRAEINRGFFVWNSEVGSRVFGLTTFLFNCVCGNHIVWGASDVNALEIRHTSGAPARFDAEAYPALEEYINASAKPIEARLRAAQSQLLPDYKEPVELLDFTNRAAKFSRSEIKSAVDFARSEEGDCRTVWQLVQGLTAYARGFEHIDTRTNLEVRAGKILDLVNN